MLLCSHYVCFCCQMDDLGLSLAIMLTLLGVVATVMTMYRKYRLRHYSIPVRDPTKGHRFIMVDMFTSTTYCNVEETRLIHGAQCDTCGICVDDSKMTEANKRIPCKAVASKDTNMKHHWVRGNLPNYSECMICGEDCGVEFSLCDLRCAWCKNTVHDSCAAKTDVCDLGKYQQFIVPPTCLEVKWVGVKGTRQRHLIIKNVRHLKVGLWTPLIVIANRKSGSNDGELLLRNFRGYLNPAQVYLRLYLLMFPSISFHAICCLTLHCLLYSLGKNLGVVFPPTFFCALSVV